MTDPAGITIDTALATARQTFATVMQRTRQGGYYTGERTPMINSHAQLCAALDMLIKAAEGTGTATQPRPPANADRQHPAGEHSPGAVRTFSTPSRAARSARRCETERSKIT